MAVLKCTECEGKVSSKADVCPHCGMKINEEKELQIEKERGDKSNKRIIKFALILGGLALVGAIFSPPKEKKCDTIGAYVFLQVEGAKRFKSPSTVDFAPYPAASIVSGDCKTYNIRTYVDAQNSYGGIVRSIVVAKIFYENGKQKILNFDVVE